MARIWFVRRQGNLWVAPGGNPACELPLKDVIFKLDLGPHRWLAHERPHPAPALRLENPGRLRKVIVEVLPADLADLPFSAFRAGYYDSPYPPAEAARRLAIPTATDPDPAGLSAA